MLFNRIINEFFLELNCLLNSFITSFVSSLVIIPFSFKTSTTKNPISAKHITDKTTVKINGSGDIAIQDASNVEAAINGSGDIAIRNVTKNFSAQIAGAGDVTVGGEVENFYCKIAGSGDIDAKKLTVSSAEIVLDGASDVTIGRIINFSKERISKASTLTVLQRG